MASAKWGKGQESYLSNEPVDGPDYTAHEMDIKPTADENADAPRENVTNSVVCHAGKGADIKDVIRWYSHTQAYKTVEPREHLPDYATLPF